MDPESFRHHVTGPIASLKVPFLRDGSIDYAGMQRFIDFAIDAGARTVLCTPGDSLYGVLTDDEIAAITRHAAQAVGKRAMFLAAGASWWTAKAVEFVRYARGVGAAAVLVSPPDRGMTVESIVEYYSAVSAEHPVFILSARLSPVGIGGAVEVVKRLLHEAPNVVGLKEDYTPGFAHQACLLAHGRWAIFAGGAKETHMDMLPYGCDGYMSIFIHHKPEIARRYWSAIERRDLAAASRIIRDYDLPLFRYIGSGFAAGGDAALHGMLELAGIAGRWRRAPLPSLTDEDLERLADFLTEKGML